MSNGSSKIVKSSDRMGVTTTAATAAAPREKSATKKVNKWDAVMSKINYQDAKIKPTMNGKEVHNNSSISSKSKIAPPPVSHLVPPSSISNNAPKVRRSPSRVVPTDNVTLRHRQLAQLRNERNNSASSTGSTHSNNHHHHRTILIETHENDAYSVQSSTESESSLPESSGPSSTSMGTKGIGGGKSYRQKSDVSSASDNSSATTTQRRLNRPGTVSSTTSSSTTRRTSKLASCTANLASSSSHSTNNQLLRRKPQPFASATQIVPATAKQEPSRKSTIPFSKTTALHLRPLRDRNRLGPDGKQISSDHHHAHHPETHNASVSSTTSTVSHKSHSSGAVNVKSAGSLASARQVNHSGHIIGDGANNNNNAGTTGGSSCNSVSALTRENTRLKEELSHQYDLVTDLRTQLDKSTECQSETKLRFEAQLNSSHERFLALSLVVQLLDSKRSALEKKLDDERRLAQGREDQLVERQKEVENLRLEFERERECIQEELAVMRRTDESQVEKIKELGDELRKTEEQLASLSQSHQDEVNLLKKKQEEELETVRIKSRELNDEDVKAHLLKRSLSSPHPCNSPNDILQKEISSQQVVIDMRNEQIRKLQQDLLTQKALLDDLSTCKEHNKTLLAKVEDLNAQLAKSRCDKQEVQKKYQDAEAGATTAQSQISQLRYENEQLKWKLQSLRTDAKVNELMSKSAVQLGCDNRINLDYETAVSSLLVDANYRLEPDLTGPPNGCVKQ